MENTLSTTLRYVLLICGILLSIPFLGLLTLLPRTPVSPVGGTYLLSYFLICVGMILARWRPQLSSVFMFFGITLALATVIIRLIFPPSGTRTNLVTLPGPSGPRLLSRLVDEQDVVLFGAKAAPYFGFISPLEKESLDFAFSQTFEEMKTKGITPLSPFLGTYLRQQSPERFDMVISEPTSGTSPATGIIFLHGFGGNFTLQCWLIAKAADRINAITVCPSTGPIGAWWSPTGEAILHETLAYLNPRGVKRIYLAGLSNGAIGASRLAPQFKQDIVGLILISGADPSATITELPVLLLHGKDDERIPVSVMDRYASIASSTATYHSFEGDHFLLLKQADQVQKVMVDWLYQQESGPP